MVRVHINISEQEHSWFEMMPVKGGQMLGACRIIWTVSVKSSNQISDKIVLQKQESLEVVVSPRL